MYLCTIFINKTKKKKKMKTFNSHMISISNWRRNSSNETSMLKSKMS